MLNGSREITEKNATNKDQIKTTHLHFNDISV